MKGKRIDLHVHTNYSDGDVSPEDIVDLAIKKNIKAIAITDHDCTDGVIKAIRYSKGKMVEVIPGIELSCENKSFGFEDIHILGLFIDYNNKNLGEVLKKIRKSRLNEKKEIVRRLNKFGIKINFHEVLKIANDEVGRPHIAMVLVKKYPKRFKCVKQVFDEYIGKGKKAYVSTRFHPSIEEGVRLIHEAGGIAILAHPGAYNRLLSLRLIEFFVDCGGDGIETYYPYNKNYECVTCKESVNMIKFFNNLAEEKGLVRSGGSDFHGSIKHIDIGELNISYSIVKLLKERLRQANHK